MKKAFLFVPVFGVCLFAAVSSLASGLCHDLFTDGPSAYMRELINKKIPLYAPVISTDIKALTTFKFDEGPSPQRNMSLPPEPKDQYIFSSETKQILELKARITDRNRSKVVQYLEGYEKDVLEAVVEQFDRMLEEFPQYYPDVFEKKVDARGNSILINKINQHRVSHQQLLKINNPGEAIELVGRLVQEDWLLMKRGASGEYELIGGYLAFPTHWSLDRNIGWTLSQIHQNLPGTAETRAQFVKMISMVLDRSLAAADRVVVRNNWFVETDARYALPDYMRQQWEGAYKVQDILDAKDRNEWLKELVCLRIERQTLRGLPKSGVVLFTIHPHVYQMKQVMDQPEVRERVARGIELKYPNADTEPIAHAVKQMLSAQEQSGAQQ